MGWRSAWAELVSLPVAPSPDHRLWLNVRPNVSYVALKNVLDETNPTHVKILNTVKCRFREETFTCESIANVIHAHRDLVRHTPFMLLCEFSQASTSPQPLDAQSSRRAAKRPEVFASGRLLSVFRKRSRTLLVDTPAGLPLPCRLSLCHALCHPFSLELAGASSRALQYCGVQMLAIVPWLLKVGVVVLLTAVPLGHTGDQNSDG